MVMQNLIKFLKFTILIYFVLCTSINAKIYKPGETINNGKFEITKKFKINLSPGTWTILRTEEFKWGYFDFRIFGTGRIENNKVVEFWEVVWGDMGVRLQGQIDPLIYSAVFKDKYDGCYERPEYYLVKVVKVGRSHNCMVISHWDVQKELYAPDDPFSKVNSAQYRKYIRENGIKFPQMGLNSYHSYFSRHNLSNWFQVNYVVDPELLEGPISKFLTEDASEYHKYNIEKHPKHKKTMEKFISIAANYHKKFEIKQKAQKHHLLDLTSYVNEDIQVKSLSKDIVKQLKELNDLYKSGALSGYEFETAKKKLLNN